MDISEIESSLLVAQMRSLRDKHLIRFSVVGKVSPTTSLLYHNKDYKYQLPNKR